MNVKEQHVVTGMSRDSAVSQHNPNLVYDAHNIRITTKDGRNSLLSVVNERGTKRMSSTGDTMEGMPIGDAIIDKYIVLFTHNAYTETNKDHIYRGRISGNTINITEIFEGDAGFSVNNPIETLSVFETEDIQKVYWVDGINQPRMINIMVSQKITDANLLEFSPSVTLQHSLSVQKNVSGGEFPVGTIQYAFSYYKINGQETRLIDVSPMYYLSPKDKGLDATAISNTSFHITVAYVDTSFDKVRVYAIVRTQENAVPQCRIVGDYDIQNIRPSVPNGVYGIDIVDNGVIGRTIEAASLYFIGGEQIIASTLAQKDNTLFLGNVEINTPNLSEVKTILDSSPITPTATTIGYNSVDDYTTTPIKAYDYYGYEPNNNRSSYFIKAFKYLERYKLGFIAQYKNGQWSEPLSLGIVTNSTKPEATISLYKRGGFTATITPEVIKKLKSLKFKRIAPVVVYPRAIGRRTVVQGIVCPTVTSYGDRESNAPFAQSSWFFRFNDFKGFSDTQPLEGNNSIRGEVQCMDSYAINNTTTGTPITPSYDAKYSNWFFINTQIATLHSPDIECAGAGIENIDLTDTQLIKVGSSYLEWNPNSTVIDHFLQAENSGINVDNSQIINISRTSNFFSQKAFTLYCDTPIDRSNGDEVSPLNTGYVIGWVVYPWQRSGSLNNQAALTSKQKANGFTQRTAILKRNIMAEAHMANSEYLDSATIISADPINMRNSTPKVFNSDQLSGVSISSRIPQGTNPETYINTSHMYYGNIDKIIVPDNSYYHTFQGWTAKTDGTESQTITQLAQKAILFSMDDPITSLDPNGHKVSDPVSMKYKSTPHIVLDSSSITFEDENCGIDTTDLQNPVVKDHRGGLFIMELIRDATDTDKFGENSTTSDSWIRCGESVELPASDTDTVNINYLQGDCYFQMYDCLKTYPFTQEDTNSVIEILSTMLETYINLDFKYDKNRGASNNVAISPTNFNLYNHLSYNQSGNFFSYHQLDYSLLKNKYFPNVVTWSLEKHLGEDVDTWMSIDANNTVELDGAFGKVNKLINYNNNIYCFQDIGISRLLFNNRVQIPTSDNVPIEITNGMKMDGKDYISTKVGCTNKWSIVETPLGLYFNDDILKATYLFNGQLTDLSTGKGMKSWMNESCNTNVWNPSTVGNCRAFYDKVGRDIYWVYANTALVYSEILGQYMSFMDYGNVPLLESINNSTYAITNGYIRRTSVDIGTPFRAGEVVINTGKITISLGGSHTKPVYLQIEWGVGGSPRNLRPAAVVYTDTSGTEDKVYITIYTCAYYSADLYTLGDVLTALNAALPSFLTATLNVAGTNPLAYRDSGAYDDISTYLNNNAESPFWELGTGEYNMFFGEYKPYWLTFISNTNPTENKIFSTIEWRDMVKQGTTDKPLDTFDHARIWTEHQDTQSVAFTNSVTSLVNKQPIQYNAADSNLRKKFNVWRFQIPRDKLSWNRRARISNPWCYIKLSRDNINTERHELTDLVVNYLV